MPFNSQSYHRNKYRREAKARLVDARELKARIAAGEAYDWEIPRLATFVRLARIDWRLYLIMRRMRDDR